MYSRKQDNLPREIFNAVLILSVLAFIGSGLIVGSLFLIIVGVLLLAYLISGK